MRAKFALPESLVRRTEMRPLRVLDGLANRMRACSRFPTRLPVDPLSDAGAAFHANPGPRDSLDWRRRS